MTSYEQVRRDWITLGDADPLWAVYVSPGAQNGRWDVEEFLALGRRDVDSARAWLDSLGLPTTWSRVLDFGCGAGRLSQALARDAGSVVGVDVSPGMLRAAERLDPPSACTFVLNDAPDLRRFPDAEFDLVYSDLVLQHLPRQLIEVYLVEFLRVLQPGGIAVFHCTSRPLTTAKGVVWRVAPHRLIGVAQRALLGYPAPMRMTAFRPSRVRSLVTGHGGAVVATATSNERSTHWQSVQYVVRRLD